LMTRNQDIQLEAATDIKFVAKQNVHLEAEKQDVKISANNNFLFKTGQNASLEIARKNLDIQLKTGDFQLKAAKSIVIRGRGGGNIQIGQGTGHIKFDTQGNLDIQGPVVNIVGETVNIKGVGISHEGGGIGMSQRQVVNRVTPSSPNVQSPFAPRASPHALQPVKVEELGEAVSDGHWNMLKKAGSRLLLKISRGGTLIGGMLVTDNESPEREWKEDEYSCRYNSDDFSLTLTDSQGVTNQYTLYPSGEIWTQDSKFIGTVNSEGEITRVAPQDDVDYRRWLAEGGESGFEQWKAQGRPKGVEDVIAPDNNLSKLNSQLDEIADAPFPSESVGAGKVWSMKGRLKAAELPTTGKIRFVPRKGYEPSNPLARGPNNGFIDRFGNEWVRGPSRTQGQAFEWDVQLSRTGKQKIGWLTRDGSHANVSLDGRITHR
jgi:hypothetical protein